MTNAQHRSLFVRRLVEALREMSQSHPFLKEILEGIDLVERKHHLEQRIGRSQARPLQP